MKKKIAQRKKKEEYEYDNTYNFYLRNLGFLKILIHCKNIYGRFIIEYLDTGKTLCNFEIIITSMWNKILISTFKRQSSNFYHVIESSRY